MSKTIVITGASDGIGAAAARTLKAHGHNVVVVGRDPDKTKAIATEISAPFEIADFSVLAQVAKLASSLINKFEAIDVLANNAGVMFGTFQKTVDGFERTFHCSCIIFHGEGPPTKLQFVPGLGVRGLRKIGLYYMFPEEA